MILLAMEDNKEFLKREMDARGWQQSDLARHSGLDPSIINNYITGKRNVGAANALDLARALKIAPENLFRAVGLLPSAPPHTEQHQQLLYLFDQLNDKDRQTILDMTKFLLSK